MITLLLRTIIIYLLVFAVMRLMGKRQLSDMQPFDLVVTLLIADVASEPISDSDIPLFYGVVPILALFILHTFVSFISMKSEKMRTLVCGKPVFVIVDGVVVEDALRVANYTLSDLTEQLRVKDVFSLSDVAYGMLETNGTLSVLKKDSGDGSHPAVMLVSDGSVRELALKSIGRDENWLKKRLSDIGAPGVSSCLFVYLDSDGSLHAQEKLGRRRGKPKTYSMRNAK